MKRFLHFFGISFVFDLKRHLAYPTAFLIGSITLPLWSLVQIFFIEVIYSQTSNFLGYSKYESFILLGTYRLSSNIAYFLFYERLHELKHLIRGTGHETFDTVLTKPIDSQFYTSVGKYGFVFLSQIFIGAAFVFYGLSKEPREIQMFQIVAYVFLLVLGVLLLYVLYSVLRSIIFWVQEFEVSEGLYDTYRNFGKYPSQLYQGSFGVVLNLVIPITLIGSLPVEILLGKVPEYMLIVYAAVMLMLFLFTRFFWLLSVKKYSSFSS